MGVILMVAMGVILIMAMGVILMVADVVLSCCPLYSLQWE
jgi:hypothetical protein